MDKKPKVGRPKLPKGEAKSATLRIRLTAAEKAVIEEQSENPSEWARERLLSGIVRPRRLS